MTRWPIAGEIVIVLNGRMYPPLMAFYAAGVAAVAANNFAVVAALVRGRLPLSTEPRRRPDAMFPVPLVLNPSEVLDRTEMNLVLNIGAERPIRYTAPKSVYVKGDSGRC